MRQTVTVGDVYGPNAGPAFAQQATVSNMPAPAGATRNQGSNPVPVVTIFGNLKNSFVGQPLTWLVAFIFILWGYKEIEERRGGREAFDEIKIGLNNFWKIGLMALLMFAAVHFLSDRYNIPGLSPFLKYATGG